MSEFENEIDGIEMQYIPGYEKLYSATKDGRIYRHASNKRKAYFLCVDRQTAYIRVCLVKNGIQSWHYVHTLVAKTYLPNPQNKPQVNHLNLNKHDNRLENLEWVTWKENWLHARNHGRFNGNMLNDEERLALYHLYLSHRYSRKDLAAMFAVSLSTVERVINQHKNIRLAA